MKKSLSVIFLAAVLALAAIPALPQAAREATIEPETKARLSLQSQLNSKLNEPGDMITAVLYEPVYVDGKLILPRGTEFHGRVTDVKPAGRGLKNGSISIIFERISMPWGEEPVSVVLTAIDDWENDEKYKADAEGKVDGKRNGKNTAENVALGGTIGTSAGIGTVLLSGSRAGGGAAIVGGLLGGLLLTKGGNVKVAPGTIFRIKFVKPLTLPVIQQYSSSPRPIQQDEPPETVKKP
ncbi:MAG: hypothetical protein L0229_10210 [Blastocatellia bacterium]|nr:hypothetical protein [Blastocatellia bacterium]